MNVQSIRLENWKKFTDPVEIKLKEGLNVLYGPNESGKSTLIDSIITTFYSKHTSGSEKIKTLKPWGTSLQPRSTITFSKDGQNYRISKGFQEKKSLLKKQEGESWRKIAEGDRADQELIELVGGQLSTRGDIKPELWGLGQTLWMVQGKPIISDDLNDETLSSLQTMVGATIESDKEKKVLGEIRSRFLEIFTEKKKSLRKGCQLSQVQDEISSLTENLSQSEQNKSRKDELIRNIEDNEFILKKNQSNLELASQEKDKKAKRVEAAREHQKNREQLEHEIQGIKSEYETLKGKIDEIKENIELIDNIKSDNENIKRQIDPLEVELTDINQKLEENNCNLETNIKKLMKPLLKRILQAIAHTSVMDEQALETKKETFPRK